MPNSFKNTIHTNSAFSLSSLLKELWRLRNELYLSGRSADNRKRLPTTAI